MAGNESKSGFLSRLTGMIGETPPRHIRDLPHVRLAFEDTLAVIFAGWGEPVTRKVIELYAGGNNAPPSTFSAANPEDEAMILGTAAHALDFDDVHQTSSTHPSAPIIAALMAAARRRPEWRERVASAFSVGLAANVGLGRVLGFPHYEKGWHATSTIGPLAAAAACSYLMGFDAGHTAAALAIAAAQAGGLQRNFGAMAKPLQAGLAAAAGLRAARLAGVGVTADEDVFGPKGYFDLYGGAEAGEDAGAITFDPGQSGIAVKLYPCCYQTHRPIAAALSARRELQEKNIPLADLDTIEILAPAGAFLPLRVLDPRTGSEGKFCGAYTVACALVDGEVGLRHFEDDAVRRPDLRAVMNRTRLTEREGKPDGMKRRSEPLDLIAKDAAGNEVLRATVIPAPGSPDSPPTPEQIRAKVNDCLAFYQRKTGDAFDYGRFQIMIGQILSVPDPVDLAEAPAVTFAAAGD